jgi:hypothetical protein
MLKNFLKSKTIWVNVLTIIGGAIVFVQDNSLFTENPDIVAVLGGVLALVNVGLRFLTDSGITIGPAPKEPTEPAK